MTITNARRNIPGLGERLITLRLDLGRSQNLLAIQAGTTPGVIVAAERHNLASTATLHKLAQALGVGIDSLVGREQVATK